MNVEHIMKLVGEYGMHFAESLMHEAASRGDVSKSAALKKLAEIRAALAQPPASQQEAEPREYSDEWLVARGDKSTQLLNDAAACLLRKGNPPEDLAPPKPAGFKRWGYVAVLVSSDGEVNWRTSRPTKRREVAEAAARDWASDVTPGNLKAEVVELYERAEPAPQAADAEVTDDWMRYDAMTHSYLTRDGTRVAAEIVDNAACLADVLHIASIRERQRAAISRTASSADGAGEQA